MLIQMFMDINPKYRAVVSPVPQITIPMDIQSNNPFLLAPKIIPIAVPNGDPNNSGDNIPKPMIPCLFQILYILDSFKSESVPYFHLRNLLLRSDPAKATIMAATIEPSEEVTVVTSRGSFKIHPRGMANHSSSIPARKTVIMLVI